LWSQLVCTAFQLLVECVAGVLPDGLAVAALEGIKAEVPAAVNILLVLWNMATLQKQSSIQAAKKSNKYNLSTSITRPL
jgi:hypothetical protein